MSGRSQRRRFARALAVAVIALLSFLPATALAIDEYPDFYATIISISADRSAITVSPTKDQLIVIDVWQLGSAPFDQGAFVPGNVILLHTKRVGTTLVATGWELARNGEEESTRTGIEQRQEEPDEEESEAAPRPRR